VGRTPVRIQARTRVPGQGRIRTGVCPERL